MAELTLQWNGCFSRVIYVGDPAIVAAIANANWPKAESQYEGFRCLSGNALFMPKAHGQWLRHRKSLSPAFGPQNIKMQYPVLVKYLTVNAFLVILWSTVSDDLDSNSSIRSDDLKTDWSISRLCTSFSRSTLSAKSASAVNSTPSSTASAVGSCRSSTSYYQNS